MENEKMGANELYLAPEETKETDKTAPTDRSEPNVPDIATDMEMPEKPREFKRMEEIPGQRGDNVKVFRMNDGTEQAVFSPSAIHVFDEETHAFEEVENTLIEDGDGRHFTCGRNRFTAKFSREEDNDDIFFIEQGIHKVTVCARKNRKNKNKGVKPQLHKSMTDGLPGADILTFANMEPDTDYEYSVEGCGVKENIVIKSPSALYRYPFTLRCENVTAQFDEQAKRISFLSKESGDEVFFIPAPFMTDAKGATSTAVSFEMKTSDAGLVFLTVTADADWIQSPQRAFPVTIDPQIRLSGASAMTTYSWDNGYLYNSSLHTIGTCGNGDGTCNAKRMYIRFNMPPLPRNPRIRKAELVFSQYTGQAASLDYPRFGLYRVDEDISLGDNTPIHDEDLIDFAKMKEGHTEKGSVITYAFDVTSLIDQVNKDEIQTQNLVMKMLDETNICNNCITLYGSAYGNTFAPQFVVSYESSYGVNTSFRTHTHALGRFGQGSVDLQCGNLMFESEDFAWSGNRMPVTIKHFFNSALAGYPYTKNDPIKLNAADFSAMKLGNGFRLNLMQSMIVFSPNEDTGYCGVYIGENGEEIYFKKSDKTVCCDSNSQCYHLYEDANGGEALYDPVKLTLTQGENISLFDSAGRLIRITDAAKNHMDITYTSGRITSVTDGAGREFGFSYNAAGQLLSISAPSDNTQITYGYTGDLLTSVTYPDGKKAVIAYVSDKPESVTLLDADATVYKVAYTFSGDRLASVTEYGSDESVGAASTYSYSVAAARTLVTTTEPMDAAEGETADNVITTAYAFDDDGNIVSEYIYSTDTGKVGGDGKESGINPHSGDGGAGIVSNINNLLTNHGFKKLTAWSAMPANAENFRINCFTSEYSAKFGKNGLHMQSYQADSLENGVYQTTEPLPAGSYTFSLYLRVLSRFSGNNAGAFIRVTDAAGNILGVSESLTEYDSEYTRLIVPFSLAEEQSVQVQILTNGKGALYADAAQLENNPYANAYNMLENGNFERGTDGWNCSVAGVSHSTDACFNMSKSLRMDGAVDAPRYAYQSPVVRSTRSTRETFTLSGWAKGHGLPNHERDNVAAPQFRLRAVVKYYDTYYREYGSEQFTANFSPCTDEWQFASVQFSKSKYRTIDYIRIYCEYGYNSGVAYFDDVQLIRNNLETYLSASDFVVESTGTSDDSVKENTANNTPTFKEATDCFGNALTETTFTDGNFGTIYRSFRFNEDDDCMAGDDAGNNLIEETDARGNKTTYTVDGDTSRNEEVTDRLGNKTAYEYDTSGRTTKVTSKDAGGNELAHVSYAYDAFDNMTEIVRGDGMKYALAYNSFHTLESIGIDGKTEKLIRYAYKNGNGRLKQMTYANGHTMKAVYNSIGQMVAEKWFESEAAAASSTATPIAHYKYVYDGDNNIVRSIDIFSKKEYNYEYEEGKIIRATESDITLSGETILSKKVLNTIKYKYDSDDNLISKTVLDGNKEIASYSFEIDETEDEVLHFKVNSSTITSHSKTDKFLRKEFDELEIGTSFVSRQFNYHAGTVTSQHQASSKLKSTATTQLVSQIVFSDGRTISYGYDAEDRIIQINDSVSGIFAYTYNALNLLETETINDVTTKFSYDEYGNIIAKGVVDENGEIAESTKICYTYGDNIWKDLLTSFDGKPITYDAQGNPLSYLGHNLTWEKGHQLKKFDNNTYTYNANGMRTSKNVNGVSHTYLVEGPKILCEKWKNNVLIPLYDNEDVVCGIIYNNVPYYFHKNLQNDIIAIVDKTGKTIASYTYDAWGACTSAVGENEIVYVNPFRYRGYYCDTETGYYYLQTRYYDPTVGRFLNSDDIKYLGTTDCSVGFNLFSYCDNNPVNRSDVNGHSWAGDRVNDLKKAAKKIAKAVVTTTKKVEATFKRASKTAGKAIITTSKRMTTKIINTSKNFANTVSGSAKDAFDWTKNKISDITKGVKKYAIKTKESIIEAWDWVTEKAFPAIGNFFKETVWKKWIVGGVWETFCKKWVWETFCKDWIWETFCKDWVWETFCKKWIWQTIIQGTWYKINSWLMDTIPKIALGNTNLISVVSIEQSNKNLLLNSKELPNKNWAINKSLINKQGDYKGYTENKADYLSSHTPGNETIFLKCCNNRDVSDVGCGLIAVYNIAILLGKPMDMRSIIYWFEQNSGFVLNGIFGVNPNVIQTFYDNMNIPAKGFSEVGALENSRTGTTGYYIICQWNDANSITYGAHFYAVSDNGTKLTAYNGPSDQFNDFSKLLAYNNQGGLIYAYKVG